MMYLLGPHLAEALGDLFDPKLIVEAFKAHDIPLTVHWVSEANLDNECWAYATKLLQWNPDTTLVFYTPRLVLEEQDSPIARLTNAKRNDDVLCMFFQNTTSEQLITLLRKTAKMKAFI